MGLLSSLFKKDIDKRPKCIYCNSYINADDSYCEHCGKSLKEPARIELSYKLCKYCGTKNSLDVTNCVNCSKNLVDYSKNCSDGIYTKKNNKIDKLLIDSASKSNDSKKEYYINLINQGIEDGDITYDDVLKLFNIKSEKVEGTKNDKKLENQKVDDIIEETSDVNESVDISEDIALLSDDIFISNSNIEESKDIEDVMGLFDDSVTTNSETLPGTLLKAIQLFIEKNPPATYYSVIYGNFKSRLNHVKDAIELKKIVDREMPSKYLRTKDYISTMESKTDVNRYEYNTIKDMDDFSIYDLSKKMPGLNWPRLEFLIQKLIDDKCIVKVKGKSYDKYKKNKVWNVDNKLIENKEKKEVKVEQKNVRVLNTISKINAKNLADNLLKNELMHNINEIMDALNTDAMSTKTLYARFKIFYSEELEKINVKNHDEFAIYLMKNLMKENLYFKSSYISRIPISSIKNIIIRHFVDKSEIYKNEYEDYISSTGLSAGYNYYSFINDMKEYYLISADCAVKDEQFNVTDTNVARIDNVLKMYFKNNDNLITNKMNIAMFPNVDNYSMNKCLIISIIRKYLSDEYVISEMDISTNNCDYLIRRK